MTTLQVWIDDLHRASEVIDDEGEKVVSKGALNIKTGARERIQGRAHLPHYPNAITYDLDRGEGRIRAEIGPDKEKSQGPLGTILENGSVNNGPIPHMAPAADEEEPRFENAAGDLAEKLLAEK